MYYYHFSVIISAWLVGLLLFWRVRTLTPNEQTDVKLPAASIIIPARNEEKNLEKLLKTLKDQCGNDDEVIIVDDDSSDRTSQIASDFGYSAVRLIGRPPEGWVGKSWACWNGYLKSNRDLLVFLDADVELSPSAISAFKEKYLKSGGLFSVQPYHRMERPYEKLSLFFNLVVIASIGSFSLWKSRSMGSFGPCLVCSKKDYEEVGGHEMIRNHVLDDIHLARLFMKNGLPVTNNLGGSLVRFRMYPDGLRSVLLGWGKNIASGAGKTSLFLLLLAVLWIAGVFSASLYLPFLRETALIIGFTAYFAYVLQIWSVSRKLGNFGFVVSALYPLFLLFFFAVFLYSSIRTFLFRSVIWKGRKINVLPR